MRLILLREDLLPNFEFIKCSQTRIEHFKPEVRDAVKIVGRAKFVNQPERGENYQYNVIHAPKETDNE